MKRKLFCLMIVASVLASCTHRRAEADASATNVPPVVEVEAEEEHTDFLFQEEDTMPVAADELFDDFIFNYANDDALQHRRTIFPLPFYNDTIPQKIEEKDWTHDYLFTQDSHYTLLFDREEDMDLVGDTTLTSVKVEWIYLQSKEVKRYYFERVDGCWKLEAINLRRLDKEEDFINFYSRFAQDSVYQRAHIRQPLRYITIDPDDEFSILETTLDTEQWFAFRPQMPTERLSNINYGQSNDDLSTSKILKMNGISDGFSVIFHFRKRAGEWELYKYEDTSI